MRSSEEVYAMFVRHRKKCLGKKMKEFMSRLPMNCRWNRKMRLKGRGLVGFCQNLAVLKERRVAVFVCDDPKTAENCPVFCCKNNPESVKAEFHEIESSPTRCGDEFPKLAVLIWFLQGEDLPVQGKRGILKGFWRRVADFAGRMAE